jgi:hypothetical protein
MARIRIRPDNKEGRQADVLDVLGVLVHVDSEHWVEVDDTTLQGLCLNPNLYEIVKDQKGGPK